MGAVVTHCRASFFGGRSRLCGGFVSGRVSEQHGHRHSCFKPSSGLAIVANFADNVPLHLNKASPPDQYADLTREYGLRHERLTPPTTFNTK